ncbi:probable protein kinase At2g41970 [Phragmites australis]|uniref:probable protein kinase At2g41970 n=1 Tax=Phragmites australis TaxID=29695 RepID=UPI002D775FE5|nr:probable protein kinase At2g41970 [Phragmites australis]
MSGPGRPRGPNAPRAIIGEGSYGQIYRAVLTSGEPVAIKKLDPSVSSDPLADFSAQLSMVSRLKNEYFLQLMSYYLDDCHRILVYQFASHGHDTLHGTVFSVHQPVPGALTIAVRKSCDTRSDTRCLTIEKILSGRRQELLRTLYRS